MKIQRILVPLDGSAFAEQILPHAIKLAHITNSELLLLRSTKIGTFIPDDVENELHCINEAQAYLDRVHSIIINHNTPLSLSPDKVTSVVVYDEPTREIPEIAAYEYTDLIMMTTHGRNGLSRLLLGSASANIIHNAKMPIIALRPKQTKEPISLETLLANSEDNNGPIVLTLDGSSKAELVVEPAIALARLTNAPIHLINVLNFQTQLSYLEAGIAFQYAPPLDYEARRQEAEEFLTKVQNRIESAGVRCQIVIREGVPSERVVEYAHEVQAQALAIATHAHSNSANVLLGSVAEDLIRHSHQPILLVNINRYVPSVEMHSRVLEEVKA